VITLLKTVHWGRLSCFVTAIMPIVDIWNSVTKIDDVETSLAADIAP